MQRHLQKIVDRRPEGSQATPPIPPSWLRLAATGGQVDFSSWEDVPSVNKMRRTPRHMAWWKLPTMSAMHANPYLFSVPGERDMSRDNYRVFQPWIVLAGLTSQLPDRRNGYFWLALSSVNHQCFEGAVSGGTTGCRLKTLTRA
jgi:hypothetical protein